MPSETKPEVKPTATPWAQGRMLDTRATRRYTASEWRVNEEVERRHVYANFSAEDEGRGRVHVAQFDRPEDAELCSRAVNAFDQIRSALEAIWAGVGDRKRNEIANAPDDALTTIPVLFGALKKLEAAILAAGGKE